MSKAKTEKERDAEFLRRWGMTKDADGKMIPAVNNPGDWRELAFAPIPKGMLALVPRRPKEGIQAADVPDCSPPLPSVKAELLGFMDRAKIKSPEAAAKWRAVFVATHLDECLLEGITDQLARRCTIRAILHLLSHFSTFVKASEGKMSSEEAHEELRGMRADMAEIKDRVKDRFTPPSDLPWWKNLRGRYREEAGKNKKEKWLGVARMVIKGAINEMGKPVRDRRSDYLTPTILGNLIEELKVGSKADIEKRWAVKLDSYVRRKEREAKKPQ